MLAQNWWGNTESFLYVYLVDLKVLKILHFETLTMYLFKMTVHDIPFGYLPQITPTEKIQNGSFFLDFKMNSTNIFSFNK